MQLRLHLCPTTTQVMEAYKSTADQTDYYHIYITIYSRIFITPIDVAL